MPSLGPDAWDRLHEDLSRHERDRETLGYSKEPPSQAEASPASRFVDIPDIPRYEILGRLGEGATAVVYRALDRELHRYVALKVQRQLVASDDVACQRFRREAQAAAGVPHPNVVMVHDAGEDKGRLYLVMELVDGRPLSELHKERRLILKELLRILEKAARGVSAAHEKGIVHRDLKPSNILVSESGEAKVADFGLAHLLDSTARLTKTGSSLGTPLYMSPEQVEGRAKDISPRTDVYSLGAILYEIVTGHVPHEGETMMEIYGRIVHDDPKSMTSWNPATPQDLQTVALKALEKDPQRRYASAKDFADDLARYLAGEPVLARPQSRSYRLYRAVRKSRVARAAALLLGIALLASAAVGVAVRDKAGRLEAEKEKSLTLLRKQARISLDAVLRLRRAGDNESMRQFVPDLEAAYKLALEGAPDVAEVEYLMGRMHRALMDEEKALGFQERALKKDPSYAPALYERAVLLANRYGSAMTKAVADARRLPPGTVTVQMARSTPLPDPLDVESGSQELIAIRDMILKDRTAIEGILSHEPDRGRPRAVSEANVLTVKGILELCRLNFPEAQRLLQEAVGKDPMLEEAWGALGESMYRQANIRSRQSKDIDEVLRAYAEADRIYEKAISFDKGYAPHWVGRADNRRHRGTYLMGRGQNGEPDLRGADKELIRALELTPDREETLYLRASVRQMLGVVRMDHSESPQKDLEAAEQDVRLILSRWSDKPTAWTLKATLHVQRARWRTREGADPLPEFEAAEKASQRAFELDPQSPTAVQDLAQTRLNRAIWRSGHGMDPLPDFAAAEKDFNEVLRFLRHTVPPWEGRAQLEYYRGLYRLSREADPLEDFTAAEKDYGEVLKVNPANARGAASRGKVLVKLAGLYEKKGETSKVIETLRAAAEDMARGIELNKGLEVEFGAELGEIRKRLAQLTPK
jgi:serine/threonine-protein kinase